MRLAILLTAAAFAASGGCLDAMTDVLDRSDVVRAPDDLVFTGGITPGFERSEPFGVPAEMRSVSIAMSLETTGAPSAPPTTPASLEVQVLSPDGKAVGPAKKLDAQRTRDTLTISNPGEGRYSLELSGNGLSDGTQGAAYRIEITYKAKTE